MQVTLHCLTIWHELHGKTFPAAVYCNDGWLYADVDIGDTVISPPLPTSKLKGLRLLKSVEKISPKAVGVIAIGDITEAWEIIMEARRKYWEERDRLYFEKHGTAPIFW